MHGGSCCRGHQQRGTGKGSRFGVKGRWGLRTGAAAAGGCGLVEGAAAGAPPQLT
jgi:hypothetical protein